MKFRNIEKHLQKHGFNSLEEALKKLKDPQIEVDDAMELLACMRRIISAAIRDKKSSKTQLGENYGNN